MQNNVRINTPIQTVDPNARLQHTKESPILNPIDPTRVTTTTNAHGAGGAKDDGLNLLLNQNSVFNRFINQLSNTPGLAQNLKKIMFEAYSLEGKPIKSGEMNSILAELSAKLQLSPDEIVEALKYQNENQTKFSGGMFDTLRAMLDENVTNKEFENLLGRFLKAYNGYFSTDDTLKAIVSNLKQISGALPLSYAKKLDALIETLTSANIEPNMEKNLITLKTEIIPFLSNYIGVTNDFGKARDIITLLINNIARLNTSSRDDVISKFVDLIDFCKFTFDMDDSTIDTLKLNFAKQLGEPEKSQNQMFDTITKLLAFGNSKDQPLASRTVYKEIATSLLLDNSVFMPLNHLFLPINYNGKFMFSEIWIEKDGKNKAVTADQKPITKLLINFDIKGTGFFEAILWICDGKVDVELNYPSALTESASGIRDNVAKIFHKNGMTINNLVLAVDEPPKRVQDVFKKLFDARRGVDVTV